MEDKSLEAKKQRVIHPTKDEVEDIKKEIAKEYKSDEDYSIDEFQRHFRNRRAEVSFRSYGILSIQEHCEKMIHYDVNDIIDVRRLVHTAQNTNDKYLIADVCKHVYERYHLKPKSELSLKQFARLVAYRLIYLGF